MTRRSIGKGLIAVMASGLAGLGLTGTARGESYEEPGYDVVATGSGYELRQFEGWIEARVTLQTPYEAATQQGFRILAGYIFGGNQSRTAIDMTTPVAAVPSETIDMTAPVMASGDGERWTVSFMMPRKWTLDTLPVPNDPRIELVEVAPSLVVVRTFSGRATKSQADRELEALRGRLPDIGLVETGAPSIAQFDPPWVMGPWRRNEVKLPVRADSGGGRG